MQDKIKFLLDVKSLFSSVALLRSLYFTVDFILEKSSVELVY